MFDNICMFTHNIQKNAKKLENIFFLWISCPLVAIVFFSRESLFSYLIHEEVCIPSMFINWIHTVAKYTVKKLYEYEYFIWTLLEFVNKFNLFKSLFVLDLFYFSLPVRSRVTKISPILLSFSYTYMAINAITIALVNNNTYA